MENKEASNEIEANEMMQVVLDHYLKHHELVLKKLILAQKATEISIKKLKSEGSHEQMASMWTEVIEVYENSGLSEDELFSIEGILTNVPKSIKEPYQELVKQDETIQKLMSSMDRKKYDEVFLAIQKTQDKPNPLSGLTSDEYKKAHEMSEGYETIKNNKPSGKQNWWSN